MSQPIGLLLADDHPLVLAALTTRLAAHEELHVVASAKNGQDALECYRQAIHDVDVIVCDLSMPGQPAGPDLVRALVDVDRDAKVLVFSANDDTSTIAACLDAGAIGLVSKQADEDELVACVLDAAEGRPAFDRVTAPKVIPALHAARRAVKLSPKELEVLQLLAEGLTNSEIGERLYVSPLTVKTHVTRILTKLEVKDRAGAVAKAFREGLVQ